MEAKTNFDVGDLVWAKREKFPFWPAKIVNPPTLKNKGICTPKGVEKKISKSKKAKSYVFFFCSENYAWILDENIVPHSEEMLKKVGHKKSAAYLKAIEKIIELSSSTPPKPMREDSVKNELTEKCPRKKLKKYPPKQDLLEHESDKELSPVRKLPGKSDASSLISNSPPGISYNQDAVIQSLDDLSSVARNNLSTLPGPSVDLSQTSTDVQDKIIKPASKKIGFIGLGRMGQRMMENLIDSGHDVSIWNSTPEQCKQFVDAGAQQYSTPADVVLNCEIIFCCVSEAEAAKSVVFDTGGVLQGLEKCQPGTKGYVEMSSLDPLASQEIADAIISKGGKFLEAYIDASTTPAEDGPILIFSAGDHSLFNSCETCFSVLSNEVFYLSDVVGACSTMNEALSKLSARTNAAVNQIMALVQQCGLSTSIFSNIIENFFDCPFLAKKVHSFVLNNPSGNNSL